MVAHERALKRIPLAVRLPRRGALLVLAFLAVSHAPAQFLPDPWKEADRIVQQVRRPSIPPREYSILDHGAVADGITDCTEAFRAAVRACLREGGGRVVVPAGVFRTGPIHLGSRVELHLTDNAVIRFDPDPSRYLPPVFTRWEGVECMNYSPLIFAFEAHDVAVTGRGILDGGGSDTTWWPWKGKKEFGWRDGMPSQDTARSRLLRMGEENLPVQDRVFGDGHYLRPAFIQTYRCRSVRIAGVTIINAPMWVIHPVLCDGVTVEDVTVRSHGPNNDGCNPESSRNVLIRGCLFDTGDDCIAIKSGRNNDGRRLNVPSENIVIQDCLFRDGHGGVTIGSEISGGARRVFARRCSVESPVLYNALRIKTNAVRGGTIEDVYLRDFTVRLVGRAAIDVDLFYEEGRNGTFLPVIRRISVEAMHVASCATAFNLVGYEEAPLRDIRLRRCTFDGAASGYTLRHVRGFSAERTAVNGKPLTVPARH